MGGIAPGGFTSDVVGQWSSYVDIHGDSVPWDDIEHVGPGMPTTWNVITENDNSNDATFGHDLGLDLGLDLYSQNRFYQ